MNYYNFYLDKKYTVWERQFYGVEADNYQEALDIIMGNDMDVYFDDSEILFDTMDAIHPKDNENKATQELYYEDELIANNEGKGKYKINFI